MILSSFIKFIDPKYALTYMDVGAKDGIPRKWSLLKEHIKTIGFEPDEREFQKLKSTDSVSYFNYVLSERSEELKFLVMRGGGVSSLYRPNMALLSEFENLERFDMMGESIIPALRVKSLDGVMAEQKIPDLDFVKIDTQGHELSILKGATESLTKLFGAQIEVEFFPIYEGVPLFRDIDAFMDSRGFFLMDIKRFYWKRKNYYDFSGKGQLVFGDAVYFKKPEALKKQLASSDRNYGRSKIAKGILICLVYRIFDYAVSLVQVGSDLGYFSQEESGNLVVDIKRFSRQNEIPNFVGRGKLSKMIRVLNEKLKPSSYLGWADSDRTIGNIRDL